jgi:hypothetical protein
MSGRSVPARHWRSYGNDPVPTGAEALDAPLRAFPSWFLPTHRVRALLQGTVDRRDAHAAGRCVDPRHSLTYAPRWLRWPGWEGGADHRRRGRLQRAGAADRAAGGVRHRGWTACWAEYRRPHAPLMRRPSRSPTAASRIRNRARRGVAPQCRHVSSEPCQIWRISCPQHHRDVAGVLSDRVRARNGPGSVGVL